MEWDYQLATNSSALGFHSRCVHVARKSRLLYSLHAPNNVLILSLEVDNQAAHKEPAIQRISSLLEGRPGESCNIPSLSTLFWLLVGVLNLIRTLLAF